MHSFFRAFSLFLFIIFHFVASDNIDTQVDTTSFSISDVQQPPFTGDLLEKPGPGTSPEELLADASEACLDPNQNNPHSKSRVRRGSPPPDYCPSPLVPEAGLITAGPKRPGYRARPTKNPVRFDPLNMPIFQDSETLENPCAYYTIAKNPVCDSGYYGPTINLAECRLCTFIDYSFLFS